MPKKPTSQQQLLAENAALRTRLEKAETTLGEIFSSESDALMIPGVAGAQLFTLKGADQSYRTLIESMSEGALTLSPDGLVLYANQRFAMMLRTPLEKVIGSEIYTRFAPESRQILQTLLQKDALDNHHEELMLVAADETLVPVYLSVSRLVQDEIDSVCMVVTDLTEQKRNEAILAAEKLSNAILEQAADAIVICDPSGRIIRASKQAQAFCGKNPLRQRFEQAFPLHQLDGTVFSSIDISDAKHSESIEAMLNSNGHEYNLLVSIGHLKNSQDELLGSVVTMTDITERKQAEEHLKLFRALLDNSSDSIEVLDPVTTRLLDVNETHCRNLGYSREEMLSMSISDIDPAFNADLNKEIEEQLRKTGETRFESVHRRKDGSTFPVEVSAKLIELDKPYALNIVRDITERKKVDEEIKFKNTMLRTQQDASPDAILVVDENTQIISYNQQFIDIWQVSPQIVSAGLDAPVIKVVADRVEDPETFVARIQYLYEHRGEKSHEEILLKDGRIIDRYSSPVTGANDKYYGRVWYFRDITERKKSEASIKYLNRVLSVLSGINMLIVRVKDLEELFREACNIATEAGGFRMAMIVIVEKDTMLPVSITSAGKDDELLTEIKNIMSSSSGMQKTLGAQAIKEKKAIISNDTQNDRRLLTGKHYAAAGINSLIVLPLIISDEAVGILALYASEIEFFQKDEMKLLTELASDIAYAIDHIEKQERLNYLAYYDVLTGLANRSLFFDRVAQYIHSAISGGHKLAIGLIDLERFKNINDSLGRSTGDALLKQVAKWLTHKIGDANLLARVGADHFAIVLPEVKSDGNLVKLVENLIAAFLEHRFGMSEAEIRIGIKVGIALFPDDGDNAEILFRNAEAALKKARASGVRYLFYTQKMTGAVADKLALENQLREAIDNEEFVLHYQPKVNLVSGKITSAEALIRWNNPRTGLVPPGTFIPILEETGLIYEVGRWALHKAMDDYLRWRAAGFSAVRIAVNVSPLQLRNTNFMDEIRQVTSLDAHAAEGLELEITESLIMEDVQFSIDTLKAIRAMGITFAIDDFGTGFSSLNYLAKLPVDTLKIDRTFVIEMDSSEGLALVSAIIILAHALKLKVVAEGVETEKQLRQLLSLNCDEMQGFLFSKPVPADIFEAKFLVPLILNKKD